MNKLLSAWRCCASDPRCWIISGAVFLWFVFYPEDLQALLLPVRELLSLTHDISLGLYVLAGIAILSCTIKKTWGRA